ncbi:MAG: hypothetical protein H6871_06825 [Methylobacteriaceae bacterium]|nr:hypothetical protein [Methylobacteriaceae bacterium]
MASRCSIAMRRRPRAQGARGARAVVFAGGALAALLAPGLMLFAGEWAGPFADAATLAAAGLVDLVALVIAVTLPHALAPQRAEALPAPPLSGFVAATIIGAIAWFVMTLLMARASPTLVACGVASAAVGGVIAWHLVAMYAPAAIIRFAGTEPPPAIALVVGLVTLMGAAALFSAGQGAASIGLALAGGRGRRLVARQRRIDAVDLRRWRANAPDAGLSRLRVAVCCADRRAGRAADLKFSSIRPSARSSNRV